MRLQKVVLFVLALGLAACQGLDGGKAIAPTPPELPVSLVPDVIVPLAAAESVPPADPSGLGIAQSGGWHPGDNVRDRCGVLLAYDPNDSSVNLRDRPTGDAMDRLPNLTPLSSQDGLAYIDPDVWNQVAVRRANGLGSTGQSGYIWHELLRRTYYQVEDTQDTYANLRQSPDGTVIDTVPNGTEVRFMGEVDVWTQVELASGQTGYVATALLTEPRCF
ncbi:MAG: SH3 domain-containing protein [Cyanobacteria bacterium J06638_22]